MIIIIVTTNRVRVEYGQDGSLESRLYLTGAGKDDTGRWMMMMMMMMTMLMMMMMLMIIRPFQKKFFFGIET